MYAVPPGLPLQPATTMRSCQAPRSPAKPPPAAAPAAARARRLARHHQGPCCSSSKAVAGPAVPAAAPATHQGLSRAGLSQTPLLAWAAGSGSKARCSALCTHNTPLMEREGPREVACAQNAAHPACSLRGQLVQHSLPRGSSTVQSRAAGQHGALLLQCMLTRACKRGQRDSRLPGKQQVPRKPLCHR